MTAPITYFGAGAWCNPGKGRIKRFKPERDAQEHLVLCDALGKLA